MRITNKMNFPPALHQLAQMDEYSRGEADISVTQLIDSPRIALMKDEFDDVTEVDVSEMLFAMLGTAFHAMVEKGDDPTATREKRYFREKNGWVVSGAIDRSEVIDEHTHIITDYKVTTTGGLRIRQKDWTEQLNCYAWLYHHEHGVWPHLEVVALLRDWTSMGAMRGEYPAKSVMRVPLDLWQPEAIERYIDERVSIHQSAREKFDETGEMVLCNEAERWASPRKWAVIKVGGKRASAVYDSIDEAIDHTKRSGEFTIEVRSSPGVRCERFCNYRAHCSQYSTMLAEEDVDMPAITE